MSDDFFLNLALPHVRKLQPYTPGLQPKVQEWVKLNTNENPYPPSPRVQEAISRELGAGLRLYPDPRSTALREAVGKYHGLEADWVCIGNGSDDILNLLIRAFCGKGQAAAATFPSYSLYPVLVANANGEMINVEFGRDMRLDVEKLAAVDANLLFLTSPNAPTGVAFPNEEIEELCRAFPGVVVVDEAYADFAEENATVLLKRNRNLCVTRTFSKSYGLAGLRVGYLVGDPGLIEIVDRLRDSYNVNRLSQVGALAALNDREYFQETVAKIKATREKYRQYFDEKGWFTYPSQTNFLFTEPRNREGKKGKAVAQALYEFLTERRILVRYFPSHDLTSSFLRISVGSEPEMLTLAKTIDQWLNSA